MLFTLLHQKPSQQTIFMSPSRVDSTLASCPCVQLMLFVSQGITQEALRHDLWLRVSSVSVRQCIKTKWGMAEPQIADGFLGLMIPACFWNTLSISFKSCDRSISGNGHLSFGKLIPVLPVTGDRTGDSMPQLGMALAQRGYLVGISGQCTSVNLWYTMDSPRLLASTTGLHLFDTQKYLDVEMWNDNFAKIYEDWPPRCQLSHLRQYIRTLTVLDTLPDPWVALQVQSLQIHSRLAMTLVVHGLRLRYEVEMVQEDARAAVRFMRKMAKEAYVQTCSNNDP